MWNRTHSKEAFSLCKKLQEPVYKVPKSIQESIPCSRISEQGTFEIEAKEGAHMYDRAYLFADINYKDKDESEQEEVFRSFCEFLNSMQANFKFQIANFHADICNLQEELFLKPDPENTNPKINRLIDGFNENLRKNMQEGRNEIEQMRFFIITCEKENFENANAYFNGLENDMLTYFKKMESGAIRLNATERLRYLFYIYNLGKESEYDLSWSALLFRHDWKNDVCNQYLQPKSRYIALEDKCVSMLYVSRYGSGVSDNFLQKLAAVPFHIVITLDSTPIPQDIAIAKLQSVYMGVENSITRQQQERNKQAAFSTEISYKKRKEKEEIEKYMTEMHDNDANLFHTNFLIMVFGDTKEDLERNVRTIKGIGKTHLMQISDCLKRQLEAFNTCLPLGGRYVDYTRPLFTQPLAGLIPFNTQELRQAGGFSYGINQVSKNLIVADRKKLANGSGMVLAIPGAGKSFTVKQEIGQVYVGTKDDLLVVDPQNEYFEICEDWGGQVIDLSVETPHRMNPFELPPKEKVPSFHGFVASQAEFAVALVHSVMQGNTTAYHSSVVERCTRLMYAEVKESWKSPTMMDLQRWLQAQEGKYMQYAKDILVAMEPFTEGSLNIFAQETNVEIKNRFTVFGLAKLESNLRKPAMLVMINFINNRVEYNSKQGVATWLWCDEFHVLTEDEVQTKEMEKCFKVFRKKGGIVTGITQNVADMLQCKETRTMISNCEYLCLLKQANLDRDLLDEVMEVSYAQLKRVTNNPIGTGLVKFGEKIIAFDNRISKKNYLYSIFNTNLHEKIEQGFVGNTPV